MQLDPRPTTRPLSNPGIAAEQGGETANTFPPAPYRIRSLDVAFQIIENLGLSRTHRRLLLLIDGQRSSYELARLLGRGEHHVDELLRDLEQATIIKLPGLR